MREYNLIWVKRTADGNHSRLNMHEKHMTAEEQKGELCGAHVKYCHLVWEINNVSSATTTVNITRQHLREMPVPAQMSSFK